MNYIPNEADLNRIERDLNRLNEALERAMPRIAEDVRFLWRREAIEGQAIDTGRFVRSIRDLEVNAGEFLTDAPGSEHAAFFVEFGRDDVENYPPRLTAKQALDAIDERDMVEQRISAEIDRILQR